VLVHTISWLLLQSVKKILSALFIRFVFVLFSFFTGKFARANNFRSSFRPNVGGGSTSRPCSGSGNPNDNPNNNFNSSEQFVTNGNDVDGDSYENDVKTKILQSSLQHVPRHGWSRDTVAAGIHTFSITLSQRTL